MPSWRLIVTGVAQVRLLASDWATEPIVVVNAEGAEATLVSQLIRKARLLATPLTSSCAGVALARVVDVEGERVAEASKISVSRMGWLN